MSLTAATAALLRKITWAKKLFAHFANAKGGDKHVMFNIV